MFVQIIFFFFCKLLSPGLCIPQFTPQDVLHPFPTSSRLFLTAVGLSLCTHNACCVSPGQDPATSEGLRGGCSGDVPKPGTLVPKLAPTQNLPSLFPPLPSCTGWGQNQINLQDLGKGLGSTDLHQ